ncbi:MAG TPA: hypothetical protein DIU15_13005 [Deltaproteobacteria bacterium]|nr:hypothetical protein [Deltaproteobacteria bacterium]HCP46958.1 hypothetical protein [Deltaproteobacteria bacterium]|tara:strand:- start:132 stop:572 length:441 start_codon:yes stop_codon:yes gene_type:complete
MTQLRSFADLEVGEVLELPFRINREQHEAFAALAGDHSLVHSDPEWAHSRGFDDVIVYGGVLLAKLSHLLGMHMPGGLGVSARWEIDYHAPLYLEEAALLVGELERKSEATRTVKIKYRIHAGERLIASGVARSLVLDDTLDDRAP